MRATPRTALTALVLLGVGAAGAWYLMRTAPTTEPTERERAAKLVQTIAIAPANEEVVVTGYGHVVPAQRLTVQPQVSGRVVSHHEALLPGGAITAGDELIAIDRSDYELVLSQQEAARKEALFELAVEEGRQAVAAREWKELKDELPPDQINEALVLREPHLNRAKALVAKADQAVAKARLDLDRTSIAAPFNAVVLDESIEVGQLVEVGDPVATLAGTDTFWVELTLPLAELEHVRLPGPGRDGAPAKVILETGESGEAVWEGHVTRLLGELEREGRLARLLVAVPDPLRLRQESSSGIPLLLGSYVRVEIAAARLDQVLEIPRAALREGDRVWLVGDDRKLRIRDAEILWRRAKTLLIADLLQEGERLVVSELKSALPGMEVSPQALEGAPDPGAPPSPPPSPPSGSTP